MTRTRAAFTLGFVVLALGFVIAADQGSVTPNATAVAGTSGTAPAPDPAWIPLFDGKSLQGWRAYKKPDASGTRWRVEDGTLTLAPRGAAPGSGDIITTDTYDRFELAWEWKIAEGGNSGLKYFIVEDRNSAIGHEYQLIDDERHPDAKVGPDRQTAAFYDVLPATNRKIKPAGEWNTSRVVVKGPTVEHYLNDGLVLTYELGSPALQKAILASKFKDVDRFGTLQKGHILLQDHGDQVWYRNIRIRRLTQP